MGFDEQDLKELRELLDQQLARTAEKPGTKPVE
jgi:hypothetical protein